MTRITSLLAATLLAACGGQLGDSQEADAHTAFNEYRLAGEIPDAPRGCEMDAVAARVAELFTAVTEGEQDIARRFFGLESEAPFYWYSFNDTVPGGLGHFAAFSRDELDGHFASRQAAGDQLVLRAIDFTGWEADTGVVGLSPLFFDYGVREPVSGRTEWRRGFGKAGYHCAAAAFVVMSISTMEADRWERMFEVHIERYAAKGP